MSEATDDATDAPLATITTDIDAESRRTIREQARSLSPTDDVVDDNTGDMCALSDASVSSILFDAEVADVCGLPDDDVVTVQFQQAVEFPKGDGWLNFEVVADVDTREVESMRIDAYLHG